MKLRILLALLLFALSSSASAGPFNDKLAICLVKSTTQDDKLTLIRWIFAAMASHPGVRDLSEVSAGAGDKLNEQVADLFVSLLTDRCGTETQEAIKYEGQGAIGTSFEVLGRVAMQELMADGKVSAFMGGIDAHIDPKVSEQLSQGQAAPKGD